MKTLKKAAVATALLLAVGVAFTGCSSYTCQAQKTNNHLPNGHRR